MHGQKFFFDQMNAADFLSHKLIDARLDGNNTIQDVSCGESGDTITPVDLRLAQVCGVRCTPRVCDLLFWLFALVHGEPILR